MHRINNISIKTIEMKKRVVLEESIKPNTVLMINAH